jgi:hypothetical protein
LEKKGIYNLVAYCLTPQSRDGFSKGYLQLGPFHSMLNSIKYFRLYDFLFSYDNLSYYSYGNLEKENSLEGDNFIAESSYEGHLRPYLNSILNFCMDIQEYTNKKEDEFYLSQSTLSNINLSQPSEVNLKEISSNSHFKSVLYSVNCFNENEKSVAFQKNLKKLNSLLSFTLQQQVKAEAEEAKEQYSHISKAKVIQREERPKIRKKYQNNTEEMLTIRESENSVEESDKEFLSSSANFSSHSKRVISQEKDENYVYYSDEDYSENSDEDDLILLGNDDSENYDYHPVASRNDSEGLI